MDVQLAVRPSARPRHGRRFAPVAEAELAEDALAAARGLPHAHRGLVVITEMTGPFGVPDFVAIVGPPDRLEARASIPVAPLLNEVEAAIVAVLAPRAARSIDTVADALGWPLPVIERRLPTLLRTGAVIEVRPGRFVRPAELEPVGRLYALESKVSDWRRAILQGRRYRLWCENYVVVMPELSNSTGLRAAEAIGADGAGLVAAGSWVRRVRAHHLSPSRRLWGSEHAYAALGPDLTSPQ
jgi:hypothetical protein